MASQNTLIWIGASSAAVVAAAAGALYWTHPDFLFGSGPPLVETHAPKPAANAGAAPSPTAPVVAAAEPGGRAAATTAAAASAAASSAVKPAFDVVTVEPTGETVVAGRAAPNAKVELKDAGKTVAEATADASGQFVMMPPALAPGGHSLSLSTGDGKAAPETSDAVAVSVPEPKAGAAVASMAARPAAPGAPAPAPLAAQTPAAPSPADASRVAIKSVEAEADGGLLAQGSAEPNALVRLYLNGADLADAKTQSDGRWSLTIKHGMAPGAYAVRADQINPAGTTVVATAEMRFDYPSAPAGAASARQVAAAASGPQSPESTAADAVVEAIQTEQVVTGETLWALSRKDYGDPTRYPVIYEANRWEIHNPNLIYPGEVFVVPKLDPKP